MSLISFRSPAGRVPVIVNGKRYEPKEFALIASTLWDRATFYEDAAFAGDWFSRSAGAYYGWNDVASSLVVIP